MQPFPGHGLFFLLRHGATDWNLEHRVMGRRSIGLNEIGRRQIRSLVAHVGRLGITTIWTSPLIRARETAEIAADALGGLPVAEDEGLTEVDYGAWEGRTFPEIACDPAYREFQVDPVHRPAPGGGESLVGVQSRVYEAMARVARKACGAPVLIVSHGDPLRLVLAGCLGLALEEFRRLRIDTGALSAVELTGDWAEVKFVNLRPDPGAMIDAERGGARASEDPARAG
jgi:ribonuclease H / adenosylcobalamin/alpha-ribazole phosphatase